MIINKDELFSGKFLSEPRYHEGGDLYTLHTINDNVAINVRHFDDAIGEMYSGRAAAIIRDHDEGVDVAYIGDYLAAEDILEFYLMASEMMPLTMFNQLFIDIGEPGDTVINIKIT